MSYPLSPLAPKNYPEMPAVKGCKLATAEANIKYVGRDDVLLIAFEQDAEIAGVFTQSDCPSAPVDWCRRYLKYGKAKAIMINSGNANAFTGKKGEETTTRTAEIAAQALETSTNKIFLASTGVIGEPFDGEKFAPIMSDLVKNARADQWDSAAKAIMTTDTYPKLTTQTFIIENQKFTLNGIAKGSGMIAPNMATMLSFLVTDAPIASGILQKLLSQLVGNSFNAITVDSDTSTSDTVLLMSSGCHEPAIEPITDIKDPRLRIFKQKLKTVMHDLALLIAKDGEGASKLITVMVSGAMTSRAAKRIAFSIADSPILKTAIAGEDANWGRVVMAVGKAGQKADRDKLDIYFGDICVATNGERAPDYDEEKLSQLMKKDHITISVDLNLGNCKAQVYTCDLTKQYVAINADYRS